MLEIQANSSKQEKKKASINAAETNFFMPVRIQI